MERGAPTQAGPGAASRLRVPHFAGRVRCVLFRLQHFLANAGVASRRAGERLILAGRVTVNGEPARQLGAKVDPACDEVALDGRTLKSRRKLYIALHKPRGFLCTRSDPQKRRTLAGLLPKEWDNLYPVGRLDHDSEGLIFLTNDGEFCLKLTHPRYAVPKTYAVTVAGRLERRILGRLTGGVLDAGQLLKANQARLLVAGSSHSVVELVLTEGKNREIRRMFAGLGLEISRLQRTRIGPIKLGELPPGKWRTLTEPEIKSLLSGL